MKRFLAVLAALGAAAAHAQSITIGLGADVTSIDPHFHLLTPNASLGEHVFDTLILKDEHQRFKPGLALEWRPVDDLTWEFKLRPGVRFHDGSEFTAEDVVFSIDRPATIKNSPGAYTIYTRAVTEKIVVDKYTVRLKTAAPYPLVPNEIGAVLIVSKRAAQNATTEDFNAGKAAIGTGPYKFVRWAKGDRIELVRNDAYWGPKAPWEKVTFRLITNDPARVAALLSGDVQAIEAVPTSDIVKLKANPEVALFRAISNRLIYLHLDSNRDASPMVTDRLGKPLDRNPLKDPRVRQALSLAVNRDAIVDRVMEGAAVPTGQLMPKGLFGYSDAMMPDKHDPEAARNLLKDAGWPGGFAVTLHGPNDRYVNDEKVAQAVAQMLTRAGVQTTVVTMPASVYFSRANRLEFSLMLVGWGSDTGEVASPLKALLATYDRDKGLGTVNRGRYSSAEMDRLLLQGLATVDDAKRERLLQEATAVAMRERGIIPLYHQVNIWAARKGIVYTPRTDERTYAHEFRPGGG
ncbi:MAG TPA: ABC transporter substrate-binding protein [Burkholderiales bacterium]|nr:ABC transporter substrate-binding protein [Burkholderiales bacterium]